MTSILEQRIERYWNGDGMVKERIKKGDAKKLILGLSKKWRTVDEICEETELKYTTAYEALKILEIRKLVERYEEGIIKKFRNKTSGESVDPEYLKLLINDYNSKNQEIHDIAFTEITNMIRFFDKKILDETFIDFVTTEYVSSKDVAQRKAIDALMFTPLIVKLQQDVEFDPENAQTQEELLMHIQQQVKDPLKKFILNSSKDLSNRIRAISNLWTLLHSNNNIQEAHAVVFDFLDGINTYDKLLEESSNVFRDIVQSYIEIKPADCKKRLRAIYDKKKNKEMRDFLLFLMKTTSIGYLDSIGNVAVEYVKTLNIHSQCCSCDHLITTGHCRAFPVGIPMDIWTAEKKHDTPREGDHGLQYKQIKSSMPFY